ncbi:MAG: hypothetical protein KGO49_07370 [Gammaproteobacteria bacterium]|nr:hypothetical protein [Gammaproteobacteria bacterium]
MLNTLLRLAFLIGGMVLLLDTFFPTKIESLKIDLHSTHVYNTQNNRTGNNIGDTEYTLHFVGGRLSSCTVGYAAYSGLRDGDAVDVQETKILKRCIAISKDGQVIQSNKYWRLLEMLFGFLLIAAGFGWLKTDEIGGISLFSWLR